MTFTVHIRHLREKIGDIADEAKIYQNNMYNGLWDIKFNTAIWKGKLCYEEK